jgi:heptaprenyl diphosphate synthase
VILLTWLKKIIFLSLLVSIGIVLGIVELIMPIPFMAPGAKLGLSNIVILITLVLFNFKNAAIVAVLKSIILSMIVGNVSSLFYSLTGSLFSLTVMYFIYKFFSKYFSLIGVSIFGAMAHNVGQILVASIVMNSFKIFYYLPVMMLTSLFTGYFVGLSSIFVVKNLKTNFKKLLGEIK